MAQAPDPPRTRTCRQCGIEKPIAHFFIHPRTGKRYGRCRDCVDANFRCRAEEREAALGEARTYPQRRRKQRHATPGLPTFLCSRCGQEKYYPEFYLNRETGRVASYCRVCSRAYARLSYVKHAEQRRRDAAEYERTHPEKKRERAKRYREKHRHEQAARRETHRLRRLGVVQKSDICPRCGSGRTELHHDCYDDVVNVTSLCHRCHMQLHYIEWRKHGGGPVKYPWEYDEE